MIWTFAGATFTWLRNGDGTLATWGRKARTSERLLLGTANAEINAFGFEPYRISGAIYCSRSNYLLLEAANGTLGTASDGTTSWQAVLELNLSARAPSGLAAGYTGTLIFTRPTP